MLEPSPKRFFFEAIGAIVFLLRIPESVSDIPVFFALNRNTPLPGSEPQRV
jgi:hypothetical protein